jgi:hypothetical protein
MHGENHLIQKLSLVGNAMKNNFMLIR